MFWVLGAGDGKAILGHGSVDGHARAYVWFKISSPDDFKLPLDDPQACRQMLLDQLPGWLPLFLQLIERCDPQSIYPRPLFALPIGHSWEHKAGLTLIGDAAHVMTPFAGMLHRFSDRWKKLIM